MKFDVNFVVERENQRTNVGKEMQAKNLNAMLLHLSSFNYNDSNPVVGISVSKKLAEDSRAVT